MFAEVSRARTEIEQYAQQRAQAQVVKKLADLAIPVVGGLIAGRFVLPPAVTPVAVVANIEQLLSHLEPQIADLERALQRMEDRLR